MNSNPTCLEWSRTELIDGDKLPSLGATHGGFTSTLVGNTIYMFLVGALYELDIHNPRWIRVPHRGDLPGARTHHSQVLCNDKLFVYGGRRLQRHGGSVEASHHLFDLCTQTWSKHDVISVSPGACYGHSADFLPLQNEVVLFGGFNGAEYSSSIYVLNVLRMRWTLVYVCGKPPSPRHGHSSSVWGNMLFIFGGKSRKSVPFNDMYAINMSFNDMYAIDMSLSRPRWSRFKCSYSPTKRIIAAMEAVSGRILLFGGIAAERAGMKFETDVHVFDILEGTWCKVDTAEPTQGYILRQHGMEPRIGFYSSVNAGSRLGLIGTEYLGAGFGNLYELEFS